MSRRLLTLVGSALTAAAGVPRVGGGTGRRVVLTVLCLLAIAAMPTAALSQLRLGPPASWALLALAAIAVGCLLAMVPSRVVEAAMDAGPDDRGGA